MFLDNAVRVKYLLNRERDELWSKKSTWNAQVRYTDRQSSQNIARRRRPNGLMIYRYNVPGGCTTKLLIAECILTNGTYDAI